MIRVLLLSDDEAVIKQSKRILNDNVALSVFNLGQYKNIEQKYDVVIVVLDKKRVESKRFEIVFNIKCKLNIPMLALLEKSSILDQFEILRLGALDYMEYPTEDETYLRKLDQLFRWKWFFERE